jgi:superfamily II DNA or RNA helicase
LDLEQAYATGAHDLLNAFYLPCLSVATKYDRAVGYFGSSLYVIAGLAFSDFAARGGKMRLVCSQEVSKQDADAITSGSAWRMIAESHICDTLDAILENAEHVPVVTFLATLVALGTLEVRIAVRPSARGIFHDKVGIFHDRAADAVTFIGSANETLSAWDPRRNHEGFEVFTSWSLGSDADRVSRHIGYFDRLWTGTCEGVATLELPEAAKQKLLRYQNLEGLDAAALTIRKHLGADDGLTGRVSTATMPERPRRPLQEHQRAVVESWEHAGHRGIITHVTGAGKTISALEVIRRWTKASKPALIVVPSELLLRQWQDEIAREFDDSEVALLLVGGGNGRRSWEPEVADFSRPTTALGGRIILSTMQSASSSAFLNRLQDGNQLLIVGDEVHRLGAPGCRPLLALKVGGALGLSATPERYGDPEGTAAIFRFFGAPLKPPVDIREAVTLHRLVPYDYYVHRVGLTSDESTSWRALTDEIAQAYAALPKDARGMPQYTDRYRLLLIRRAKIVKQAVNKTPLARQMLTAEYREGDRWLVYCDDSAQLEAVTEELRSAALPVYQYFSDMTGSRDATMAAFATHGGVLVAIKCLDEGVNLPTVNRALILASSANPREFIQRRGRVLRAAPGKL